MLRPNVWIPPAVCGLWGGHTYLCYEVSEFLFYYLFFNMIIYVHASSVFIWFWVIDDKWWLWWFSQFGVELSTFNFAFNLIFISHNNLTFHLYNVLHNKFSASEMHFWRINSLVYKTIVRMDGPWTSVMLLSMCIIYIFSSSNDMLNTNRNIVPK